MSYSVRDFVHFKNGSTFWRFVMMYFYATQRIRLLSINIRLKAGRITLIRNVAGTVLLFSPGW